MNALETLVRAYYRYTEQGGSLITLVESCASYVTEMFRVFGLIDAEKAIGFNLASGAADQETVLGPTIAALCTFRKRGSAFELALSVVREQRMDASALLKLCDEVSLVMGPESSCAMIFFLSWGFASKIFRMETRSGSWKIARS